MSARCLRRGEVRLALLLETLHALDQLRELLASHPGPSQVTLSLVGASGERSFTLGDDFRVANGAPLRSELELMFGRGSLAQAA
jgi:hypothetical protein